MEVESISIFENLSLIYKAMPYFGYTHRIFLILSILCKKTRNVLKHNYKVFRKIMIDYSLEKIVTIEELLELNIPYDLFKFNIRYDFFCVGIEKLISFANKIANKNGPYFEGYYMNEQLCCSIIYVQVVSIEDLYPHVCLLESIEVIDKDNYSYSENKKLTLLDQIVLNGTIRSNIFNSCANICYFKDNKCEIINPIYKPFKRIAWLHINSDDLHTLLKMIKEANISEIENLNFNQLDPRDLEESLDHENFNFKIQQLYYDEKDCELLSEVSLNNICKIKPRQLHLSRLISMSHLIMILSNIHEDIIINFQCSSSDELSLKFSNTIAYFKDKKDILKIFCNLICFKLNNRDKNEIIFYDKQNIAVSLCETMRIKSITKEINSTNFTVENDSSFNLIKDDFCILPISGLREICLSIEQLQEILENEINKIYVPELLPSIKIVISLQSTNDVVKFDELSMHLPKHCELKIRDIYFSKFDKRNQENKIAFFKVISSFKLRAFISNYKTETETIISILSLPSVQKSLMRIRCDKLLASKCVSILSLCKDCRLLESIELDLKGKLHPKYEEQIAEAKKEIISCCENIRTVRIE